MPNIFFPAPKADNGGDQTGPVDEGEKTACTLAALVHLLKADLDATMAEHLESAVTHMESAAASWDHACAEVKNLVGAIRDIENKDKQAGEALLRDLLPRGDRPESYPLTNVKNAVDFLLKSRQYHTIRLRDPADASQYLQHNDTEKGLTTGCGRRDRHQDGGGGAAEIGTCTQGHAALL